MKDSTFNVPRVAWLFFVVVTGCATTVPLPKDYSVQKRVILPFKVEAIVINDLRTDTTSVDMDLPVFVAKQKEWKKSPTLSAELGSEIKAMIQASSFPEGLPAVVTLSINEGYYRLYGNAWQVGEYAFFECKIKYQSKESGESWSVMSNSFNDYSGVFNATEKHVAQSYKITVRNAVFKALKESEKIFGVQ